jgi:hypothetical protein
MFDGRLQEPQIFLFMILVCATREIAPYRGIIPGQDGIGVGIATELPAAVSSVQRHPPISCLLSNIPTLMPPYLARYMAKKRALVPPPIVTASNALSDMLLFLD